MKTITFLSILTSILLVLSAGAKAEIADKTKLSVHKIEDDEWFAKGGKIALKEGLWRIGLKEKVSKAKVPRIEEEDYTFFCTFTVINNSEKTYKINVLISLLDSNRATLCKIPPVRHYEDSEKNKELQESYEKRRPFKPEVLKPQEGYRFQDEFRVSEEIAAKVCRLKLTLLAEEVK